MYIRVRIFYALRIFYAQNVQYVFIIFNCRKIEVNFRHPNISQFLFFYLAFIT